MVKDQYFESLLKKVYDKHHIQQESIIIQIHRNNTSRKLVVFEREPEVISFELVCIKRIKP